MEAAILSPQEKVAGTNSPPWPSLPEPSLTLPDFCEPAGASLRSRVASVPILRDFSGAAYLLLEGLPPGLAPGSLTCSGPLGHVGQTDVSAPARA